MSDTSAPTMPAATDVPPSKGGGDNGGTGNDAKSRSLMQDAVRDLVRRPVFIVSAGVILFLCVIAAFPGLFTDVDPRACSLSRSLQGPSADAWFGYDARGCDVYARAIHGTRTSIVVGVLATVGSALIGGLFGTLAGYLGGWMDSVISRGIDIFLGLPFLVGAIVILNAFRNPDTGARVGGIWGVLAALTILGWMSMARVMRSSVIQTKQADYVAAARSLGASTSRMVLRHILPNAVTPLIVVATIGLGVIISAEATLSFLGVGVQPPTISWGVMVSESLGRVREALHPLLFPAAFVSVTVLAFIMLGDAVRDALDPKLR
ncbi:ABC transporter permease subunit [Streptomyces sp. TRM43335]|uniref:ABC transporter permease subunit n=1 Tax=Streptomyces taklimakanensis TaxID=2569853 RepID=A0A6G2BFH9_9ACTN|nr:ABC transporter permease [Streptomyces taklimakanensis]MTE20829.1 ABC transporter permease subunit [Streptomyces taklimakanensis]